MTSNARCFVCLTIPNNTEVVGEFVNPDQKELLLYEMKTILPRLDKSVKGSVSETPSSNGTWYSKITPKHTLFLLTSKEIDSKMSIHMLNQLVTLTLKTNLDDPASVRALRSSISQSIRQFNSKSNNLKLASSNVNQLHDMVRGNVNKLVSNVADLQDVQKKSERLSEMSLTFEGSARELEKAMARKRLIVRVIVAVVVVLTIALLIYVVM